MRRTICHPMYAHVAAVLCLAAVLCRIATVRGAPGSGPLPLPLPLPEAERGALAPGGHLPGERLPLPWERRQLGRMPAGRRRSQAGAPRGKVQPPLAARVTRDSPVLFAASALGQPHRPTGGRLSSRAPLVLVLAPGLTLDDLTGPKYPHLAALARQSAAGWMNITTRPGRTDLASACLTLGAGVRVVADREAPHGRLGELLAAAGRRVGAVITGDRSGGGELLLAVMDARGAVPAGIVGDYLLRRAPDRPYGIAADRASVARTAERLLGTCDVVAVDPGDMERARRYAPLCLPARAREHARAALQDLDFLVGALWPRVRKRAGTLFVLSPVASSDGPGAFGLVLAAGPSWPPGWLASGSTRVPGLVTNTDFLPTVLKVTGVRASASSSTPGRPFTSTGAGNLGDLRELAIRSARAEAVRGPAWTVLRAALLLLLACAAVTRGRGRLADRLLPAPMLLMLLLLLAGDLVAPPSLARATAHALVGLIALAAALYYWVPATRAVPDPAAHQALRTAHCLLALGGAAVVLLLGELLTGGHLLRWSPLGYSLALGARYYGIGNEAQGVLLGAALLLPFVAAEALPRHSRAVVWGGAALYGLTLVLVGSPTFGADFGGALAAAVAFALALPALAGRRLRARHALAALAALLVATALFAAWDAGRPAAAQTHVGRLLAATHAAGLAPLAAAVAGKALTAARVALGLWGALLLGEAVVGWILLRRAPACRPAACVAPTPLRAVPPSHRLLRGGLALLLPTAAALLLFNDSGVIAAALALAPFPLAAPAIAGSEETRDNPAERPGFRQNPE
jgi:hypothetical protein